MNPNRMNWEMLEHKEGSWDAASPHRGMLLDVYLNALTLIPLHVIIPPSNYTLIGCHICHNCSANRLGQSTWSGSSWHSYCSFLTHTHTHLKAAQSFSGTLLAKYLVCMCRQVSNSAPSGQGLGIRYHPVA